MGVLEVLIKITQNDIVDFETAQNALLKELKMFLAWYKKAAEKGHPDEPKEALERLADQGIWEAKKALEDLENS